MLKASASWLGRLTLIIGLLLLTVFATLIFKPDWYLQAADTALKNHNGTRLSTKAIDAQPAKGQWQVKGLRLSNPSWPEATILELEQARFSISASPWPWRWGKQGFWELYLDGVNLRLESNDRGERNWPAQAQADAGENKDLNNANQTQGSNATPRIPSYFGLKTLHIENLQFRQSSPEQEQDISIPTLLVKRQGAHSLAISASPLINGERFDIEGQASFASAENTSSASEELQLQLRMLHPLMSLESGGQLLLQPGWNGSQLRLQLSLADIPGIARLAQQPMALHEDIREATISGHLRVDHAWHLEALQLNIGDQTIRGKASYQLAQEGLPASLAIALHSEALKLDALLPQANNEAATDTDTNDSDNSGGNDNHKATQNSSALAPELKQQLASWAGPESEISLLVDKLSYQDWRLEKLNTTVQLKPASANQPAYATVKLASQKSFRGEASLENLSLSATAGASKREQALVDVSAKAGYPGFHLAFDTSVNGELFSGAAASPGNHLDIRLDSDSLENIWPLLGQNWAAPGPVAFQLTGTTAAGQATAQAQMTMAGINAEPGHAQFGINYKQANTTEAAGQWTIDIKATNLDLRFLESQASASPKENSEAADAIPLAPEETATAEPAKNAATRKSSKTPAPLFADEPLPLEFLQHNSLTGALALKDIYLPGIQLQSLTATPQLQDKILDIPNLSATLAEGSIDAMLRLDTAQDVAQLSAALQANKLSAEALGLDKSARLSGGTLQTNLRIDAQGNSPKALANTSSGELALRMQDMRLDNAQVNMLGSDLILETLQKLNPFAKTEKATPLECVDIRFQGENGLFKSLDPLLVETNKMRILGRGHIDLGEERLKFGFTPVAKQGIGVNIGSVAQAVGIAGPIRSPKPVADAEGLLKTTLSAGAAISTGGLSLLAEGLFRRATTGPSPCAEAK